jgi:hypothetical protein
MEKIPVFQPHIGVDTLKHLIDAPCTLAGWAWALSRRNLKSALPITLSLRIFMCGSN